MRRLALGLLLAAVTAAGVRAASDTTSEALFWRSQTPAEREMFAIGVREGSLRGFNQLALALTPNLKGPLFGSAERFNRLRKDVVLDHFNVGAIVAVATSLYEDPANQYISLIDVLFIAQAKLDGEDVENRLRTARAAAAYVLRNP